MLNSCDLEKPRIILTDHTGKRFHFPACDFHSTQIGPQLWRLKCKRCGHKVEQHKPKRVRACGQNPIHVEAAPAWWRKWLPKPGDLLAAAIYRATGITLEAGGCKCKQRRNHMNAKGWLWCVKNLRTIYGWLREGWLTVYRRPK